MKRLVILGFGGYGKTIEDVVLSAKLYDEIVFLDDGSKDARVEGRCMDFEKYISADTHFYPAFGNNTLRMKWIETFDAAGAFVPTIIHPQAYVSRNAVIGRGTAVLPNATVNTTAVISEGCIVNFGAVVDHDVVIGKGVHLCLNCAVKAYNHIPPYSKIEAGKIILNNTFKQEN